MRRDTPAEGREMGVDILRGLCIISMVLAHLANGGVGYQVSHAALFVDGAHGFVLLSGLVVGIVQRKYVTRGGPAAGQLKALRRARLVYVGHIALCMLAFLAVATFPERDDRYAGVADQGGWWGLTWRTLTLQINPPQASILSLYVVLLLLTAVAVRVLASGRWWLVAGASSALYVTGAVLPTVFTLPRELGQFGEINWAMWQVLYMGALLVGWHWRTAGVRRILRSPATWAAGAALVAVIVAFGYAARADLVPGAVGIAAPRVLGSGQLGPGTALLAFATAVLLYPVATWAARRIRPVVSPVATVGRRSLDCYIWLSVLVLLVPSPLGWDRDAASAHLVVAAVLLFMWAWCALRDRGVVRLPGRRDIRLAWQAADPTGS